MRILILCLLLLSIFCRYLNAEESRDALPMQNEGRLKSTLKNADLVGDEYFDRAFKSFGVQKPNELNRTIFLAFPQNGRVVPEELKTENINVQFDVWDRAKMDVEDKQGHKFSIALSLGPNSQLQVMSLIMDGARMRVAPFSHGEPKVGHYANSGWLDLCFCLNNCVVGLAAPRPEDGSKAPDWPKIFEPIARQMVAILSTSPSPDAKETPDKFNVKLSKDGEAQIIECKYDASIDDFWIRCETSSGKLIRLDRNRAKWLSENGQDAVVTLVAISVDGKTTYKATVPLQAEKKAPVVSLNLPDFKAATPSLDTLNQISGSYEEIAKKLLAALREPGISAESKAYVIYLLGVYRVQEAVPDLVNALDFEGPFTIENGYEPYGVHPAAKALRRIGRSATSGIVSSLANEQRENYCGVICTLIMDIEGNKVALVLLQEAIDKEQDETRKANLQAALDYMNLRIQEIEKTEKRP